MRRLAVRQFGRLTGTQPGGGRQAFEILLKPASQSSRVSGLRPSTFTARRQYIMGRKTYSLSAAAVVATAGLTVSNADGAVAFAQAGLADIVVSQPDPGEEPVDLSEEAFEIVPMDAVAEPEIDFVSRAVVQELPGDDGFDPGEAENLSELVNSLEPDELTDQLECLAGAVYFEARGEPLSGQLAVANVVINRSEDARWPASYCGVVYQRAQFSFVKNGRMPRVNTNSGAWHRAKAIAQVAHEGLWESEAGDAVYFHANYVRPKWSRRKERLAQIDTHIFYR